jgi:DNA-binding NtrC family response regulator
VPPDVSAIPLDRIAASDATVLIVGETGTGKHVIADAIHRTSPRARGKLFVVNCGAVPDTLFESELFGHAAGAFTGATHRRVGAFEAAAGGTLFLDEIGELPLDLQPKLLRAVETREIRPLGTTDTISCDVRIVAATNRDLRAEVARGRFRHDLYFRLAVVRVELRPLRERVHELPRLVGELLDELGAGAKLHRDLTSPAYLAMLADAPWPGNVRELRNHLAECVVYGEPRPVARAAAPPLPITVGDVRYEDARRRALHAFELEYVTSLLERHGGKVAKAARAAGVNRAYLHRLLRRHGLR